MYQTLKRMLFPLAQLLAAVILHTPMAAASCYDMCSTQCGDSGYGASSCTQTCSMSCQGQEDAMNQGSGAGQAPHVRKYGAIALSASTVEYGISYNFDSREQAEEAALTYCYSNANKPRDCQVLVWFYDACASLAIKPDSGRKDAAWGAQWASSIQSANAKALEVCRKYGGNDCKTEKSFCSPQ